MSENDVLLLLEKLDSVDAALQRQNDIFTGFVFILGSIFGLILIKLLWETIGK